MVAKRCKDCGQPVKWVMTKSGRWLALMESPDPSGTFVLRSFVTIEGRQEKRAYGLTKHERADAEAKGELLWLPHVAACTAIPKVVPKGMPPHLRDKLYRNKKKAKL